MLKKDYKRWKKVTKTDYHDLDYPELHQLINELKDVITEILKEYENLIDSNCNLENENSSLKADYRRDRII